MNISNQPLTNGAYGFPRGSRRRMTPYVLAVVHQTSNATSNAQGERNHANRAGSPGPSATYYVDRDGSVVAAVDAELYASWSSGDVRAPDLSIPTVARMVADRAANPGWVPLMNANEAVWDQYECCGAGPEPWTDAQFETVAQLIAARAQVTGLPIDRTTVLAHRDINTIDRASDPWPADRREDRMARLIARANAIANPPQEDHMAGLKSSSALLGTVTIGEGHALFSVATPREFYPQQAGKELRVIGAVDLVGDNFAPIDCDGAQPPRGTRNQCWLVDADGFGFAALALREDCTDLVPPVGPATPPALDVDAIRTAERERIAAAEAARIAAL